MTAVKGRCHTDEFCCFTDMNCLRDTTGTKHLDKRRRSMRKAASFSRWSLLMGVACGLAMLTAANCAARAESITITVMVPGHPSIAVMTIPPPPLNPTQSFGTANLNMLNTALNIDGSAYQFTALGGNSNWPGTSTSAGGYLQLTG